MNAAPVTGKQTSKRWHYFFLEPLPRRRGLGAWRNREIHLIFAHPRIYNYKFENLRYQFYIFEVS
jgi:hypothetical protein